MWQDNLEVGIFGDSKVSVWRVIESPATPDELALTFSDGSQLFVRVVVTHPPDIDSEMEATKLANNTTAYKVYGKFIKALYARAHYKKLDVDIGGPAQEGARRAIPMPELRQGDIESLLDNLDDTPKSVDGGEEEQA
jgi:hypothetical protein